MSALKLFKIILIIVFSLTGFLAVQTTASADEASVSIYLDIESATSTLFKASINVSPCAPTASSTATVSGYCAIRQSGLENTWSSFGGAQFLESVGGVPNASLNNLYWGWFSDLNYGQSSLDQHLLVPGERLLLTIGKMPLRLTVSTTTPSLNATTTVSVSQFGFDDAWNGVWLPAATSTIYLADTAYATTIDGRYDLLISTSTPFTLFATKAGFVDSPALLVSPLVLDNSTTTSAATTSSDTTPAASSNSTDSDDEEATQCAFNTSRAWQFLRAQQQADGSFGLPLYTDWTAIALATSPSSPTNDPLISYLKSATDGLTSATDYERRAMALMAMEINPYTGTALNYIQKIIEKFDGTQVGRASLVNDDIFAIFPLIKAGYSRHDEMIQKIVAFIISQQQNDGSWSGSIDLTAAAIQALELVPTAASSRAITTARTYLVEHQQSDGGFGSSFSTSWVLQAIAALGEDDTDWLKNAHTPKESLCLAQQSDGGLESIDTDQTTRLWATAYALPAVLGKPWPSILSSFSKPAAQTEVRDERPASLPSATSTLATSSVPMALNQTILPLSPVTTVMATTAPELDFKPVPDIQVEASVLASTTEPKDFRPVTAALGSKALAAVAASGPALPNKIILPLVVILIILAVGIIIYYRLKKKT